VTAGVSDTVAVGDHVDVHSFVRRGDDADTDVLNGWVAMLSDERILIAAASDWQTDEDPWFASFPLTGPDRVVVTLDRSSTRVH
jgi:hypothetical protein